MLFERSNVCCGYMPYGWLGPVSKGFSDMLVVANEAVELTESRCCIGDCDITGRLLNPRGRLSCVIEFRTFAVLFLVAVRRRSFTGAFDVEYCLCGISLRSLSCGWPIRLSSVLACVWRKPRPSETIKSSSSKSISCSSSKTLWTLSRCESVLSWLLRRDIARRGP